jgi:hypothetical protein
MPFGGARYDAQGVEVHHAPVGVLSGLRKLVRLYLMCHPVEAGGVQTGVGDVEASASAGQFDDGRREVFSFYVSFGADIEDDIDALADAEIAAWAAWNDGVYERRRLQAEVIVTRPHSALRGHRTLVPSNSVLLRDGWGRILLRGVVKRTGEWQPDAVNRLGSRGAFVYRPDMQRIWRNIAVIQRQYPEFFMGGLSVRFNEQPV